MLEIRYFKEPHLAIERFNSLVSQIYPESELNLKLDSAFQGTYLHTNIGILKNDTIAAFASIFVNTGIDFNPIATIGNFESINDFEVSKLLFQTIESYVEKLNINFIIGPMNGSTWEKYRLTRSSSHPLFFSEEPFPSYYANHFEQNGYRINHTYISNKQTIFQPSEEQKVWLERYKFENKLIFNYLDKESYISQLPRIHEFCNLCFKENNLFSPISKIDFVKKYTQLEALIHPISVLLVENAERTILGLLLTIPNYYSRNELIVKTMAVHPEFRSRGLANAFGIELMNTASNHQFETIIHAFMHDDNHSKKVSEKYHGEIIREYILYTKDL